MKKILEETSKVFWLFVIGSIIGYVLEMTVGFIEKGYFESRQGLIYGPFIPVYGIGVIIFYLIIPKIKDKRAIFIISMILGGTIEFLCSYVQEKCFGTISWDYSNMWFNIGGRTSVFYCVLWGIGGLLASQFIFPLIQKTQKYQENIYFKIITTVMAIFMLFDITISCLAGNRQEERMKQMKASNKIEVLLDQYYPDDKMNKIYTNRIVKVKK